MWLYQLAFNQRSKIGVRYFLRDLFQELAYMIVRVARTNLKSQRSAIREGTWNPKYQLKLLPIGRIFSSSRETSFCFEHLSTDWIRLTQKISDNLSVNVDWWWSLITSTKYLTRHRLVFDELTGDSSLDKLTHQKTIIMVKSKFKI